MRETTFITTISLMCGLSLPGVILLALVLPAGAYDGHSEETLNQVYLYFHVRDCLKDEVLYAGQAGLAHTVAYPLLDEARLRIVLEGKDGKILGETEVRNPHFVRSPNPNFRITECRYDVAVPVTRDLDQSSVRKVSFLETGLTSSTSSYTYTGFLSTTTHLEHVNDAKFHKDVRPLATALWQSGPSDTKIDLVILGDGFTREEMSISSEEALQKSRFGQEARRVIDRLFALEPYRSLKDHFNVWIVGTPSAESGADIPSEGIFRRTYFNASFDRGCMRRAIEVRDKASLLRAASLVPFDQTILLVNSQEYGGNSGLVLVASLNKERSGDLVAHEFTHSITRQVAHIVDTYYYFSDLQFVGGSPHCEDRQYGQKLEPVANEDAKEHGTQGAEIAGDEELGANITLDANLATVKWRHLLTADAPVVRFVYPIGAAKLDKASGTVSFQFLPDVNMDPVILFGGRSRSRNAAIASASTITLNGKAFPMASVRRHLSGTGNRAMIFLKLEGLRLRRGEKIEFSLSISDPSAIKTLEGKLADASLLTLPTRIFDPDIPGLFQGGHAYVPGKAGLRDVWRSSYRSFMSDPESPFDPIEQEAIRRSILELTDKP